MSNAVHTGPVRDLPDEAESVETMSLVDGAGALSAVDRASIDVQIATAKQYPRVISKSLKEAMDLATLDEETAGSMFYALPRSGKTIEGPSARLAEVMAYSWGNLRVDADIVAEDKTTVTAMGTCFDLEKNVAVRVRVKRRITDKHGKRYNEDMIGVTSNAAISIALRNCVFKVVPRAFVDRIYGAAREASIGKAGTLTQKRQSAMATFGKMGVQPAEVFKALGVSDIDDIGMEELITLRGLLTAIREGNTTVEETFRASDKSEGTQDLNAALNGKPNAEQSAAPAAPAPASPAAAPAPRPASKKPEPTPTPAPRSVCEKCGGADGKHASDCPYYAD